MGNRIAKIILLVVLFALTFLLLSILPNKKVFAQSTCDVVGEECQAKTYGENFCCAAVPPTKPNNVCNFEYTWRYDNDCICTRQEGTVNTVAHDCSKLSYCCHTPTATPTPTETPTPAPTGVAACDANCGQGVCGYKNSDGSCTTNNSCCHRTCSGGSCITVAGSGTNACDTDPQCVGVTPTATPAPTSTPTPTPTPIPPAITSQSADCPYDGTFNFGNIAYLSWTTSGTVTRSLYAVKPAGGSWSPWQETNTKTGAWPTTAGSTYEWAVSACNGSFCSCSGADCTVYSFSCGTAGQPPAPSVTTALSCINAGYAGTGFTVSWTNSGVTWVDIDKNIDANSNFPEPYWHKGSAHFLTPFSANAPGTPPNEFGAFPSGSALTFNPSTTYYARTYNGTRHSQVRTFTTPIACTPTTVPTATPVPGASPTPTSTPTPTGGPAPTATPPAGAPPTPTVNLDCDQDTLTLSKPTGTSYYQITINNSLFAPNYPAPTDPTIYYYNFLRNTDYTYSVTACSSSNFCSAPATGSKTCPNTISPWIFVDGDVHSNTGINAPGGP